jgi:hypothetical protein
MLLARTDLNRARRDNDVPAVEDERRHLLLFALLAAVLAAANARRERSRHGRHRRVEEINELSACVSHFLHANHIRVRQALRSEKRGDARVRLIENGQVRHALRERNDRRLLLGDDAVRLGRDLSKKAIQLANENNEAES